MTKQSREKIHAGAVILCALLVISTAVLTLGALAAAPHIENNDFALQICIIAMVNTISWTSLFVLVLHLTNQMEGN